jgi:uncharacterized protein with HEPN domain
MKSDKVYINQILDAIAKIELFISDANKEAFFSDQKTQSAIIMQLTIIGELAKSISSETKMLVDLPWKDIVGFRNRAIHDYFGMDLEIVWNTIQIDLPILKNELIKVK